MGTERLFDPTLCKKIWPRFDLEGGEKIGKAIQVIQGRP